MIYCIQTLFRWEMADNFPTNFEVPREADTDASGSAGVPTALPPPKLKSSRHDHYLFFCWFLNDKKNHWFVQRANQGHLAEGEDTFHSSNRATRIQGSHDKGIVKIKQVNIPWEHSWHNAVVLFVQPTGHSAAEQWGSALWTSWTSFRRVVSLSKWNQDFDWLFKEIWFVIKEADRGPRSDK